MKSYRIDDAGFRYSTPGTTELHYLFIPNPENDGSMAEYIARLIRETPCEEFDSLRDWSLLMWLLDEEE